MSRVLSLAVLFCTAAFLSAQPPGMQQQQRKLIPQFDKDGDGRLNTAERAEARKFLKENPARGGFGGRGGPPGGFGRGNEPEPKPGPKILQTSHLARRK